MSVNTYSPDYFEQLYKEKWQVCRLEYSITDAKVENIISWCRETFGIMYGLVDTLTLHSHGIWYFENILGQNYFFFKYESEANFFHLRYNDIIVTSFTL